MPAIGRGRIAIIIGMTAVLFTLISATGTIAQAAVKIEGDEWRQGDDFWRRTNRKWAAEGDFRDDTAVFSPDTPVVASSKETWTLILTVGKDEIKPGGRILVGPYQIWGRGEGGFQNSTPTGQGYIKVFTSNKASRVKVNVKPNPTSLIMLQIMEAPLRRNDTVTIIIGDKSKGGQGWQSQPRAMEGLRFVVAIDSDGNDLFRRIRKFPTRDNIGRVTKKLYVISQATPAVGEQFDLTVSALDEYVNRAPAYTGTVSFSSTDPKAILPAPYTFSAADKGSHTFPGLKIMSEGVHYITVRDEANSFKVTSNPIVTNFTKSGEHVYFGDLHGHTYFSDGYGRAEEYYEWGRDVENLDFCALADHTENFHGLTSWDEKKWVRYRETCVRYNNPGSFATILGYEWTDWGKYGNHNVYFRDAEQPYTNFYRSGREGVQQGSSTLEGLCEMLRNKEAIAIPHHSRIWIDWKNKAYQQYPDLLPLVEIYSHWGNSEDSLGLAPWKRDVVRGGTVQYALALGHRFGFIASSDTHNGRGGWGESYEERSRAAVYANNLTTEDIFDALASRRTYATTGKHILLDFEMDGHPMGSEYTTDKPPRITGKVVGTAPLYKIEVIKDNEVVHVEGGANRNPLFKVEWGSASGRQSVRWKVTLTTKEGVFKTAMPYSFESQDTIKAMKPHKVVCLSTTNNREKAADGVIVEIDAPDAVVHLATEGIEGEFRWDELDNGPLKFGPGFPGKYVTVTKEVAPLAKVQYAFSYVDPNPISGKSFFYLRVTQTDSEMAWSSPIWVSSK